MGDARRSADLKKSLIALLSSGDLKPPPKLTAASPRGDADGLVSVNFARGSVMIAPQQANAAPGPARLVFADAGEAVPVPAGVYRVKNYSIETGKDDEEWLLSASGNSGRTVQVIAGKPTTIEFQDGVKSHLIVNHNKDGLGCCAAIKGDANMGVTIVRQRQRIPFKFVLLGKNGKRLGGDDMAYN